MQFFHRASGWPGHLGVFPGTFNPVTVAHLALARAALPRLDEILFVLPRVFPHKEYSGVSFESRLSILKAATAATGPVSVASSDGGLFLEIARECRQHYGGQVRLSFLCGRDAAERIVNWDYGQPGACLAMLREFQLLVAARQGQYRPPPEFAHAVQHLDIDEDWDSVSATEVRRRIALCEPWEHLVPPAAQELVRRAYVDRL
jgi:nicotinic acid mononucleotide adenylyltransferase